MTLSSAAANVNRLLKNVAEAADARQKTGEKAEFMCDK